MPARLTTRPRRRRLTALLAVPGLVAGITAGAQSAAADPALTPQYAKDIAGNILHLINQERAEHHLPALRMQWRLINAANRHNQVMAASDTMSHQVPGEPPLGARISATGFAWTWAGENVGWSNDMSVRGVRRLEYTMYGERPPGEVGHRLNILSTHYQYVGIAVRWDRAHRKVWLTEDFARSAR